MRSLRRARILAFFLDVLVCAAVADGVGLAASAAIWIWAPAGRGLLVWLWAGCALGGVAAFLLRDSAGGRARRWLALEVRDPEGRPPGPSGSIRRNLPLVIPLWNLWEAWPMFKSGQAQRRSDRKRGWRVVSTV